MSREARRRESTPVRLALAESDLDRHEERLDAIEATSGANRTAFWTNLATIAVAIITVVGSVIAVVLT